MRKLPDHCAEGLRMAGCSLRVNPSRDFWGQDLMQAGRVALWRKAPPCTRDAYVVARSAMIDELRNVTPGGRAADGEGGRGLKVIHIEWGPDSDTRECPDSPDRVLEATQALAAMEERAPGWAAALAEEPTLLAAGRRMGVCESRAFQMREILRAIVAA